MRSICKLGIFGFIAPLVVGLVHSSTSYAQPIPNVTLQVESATLLNDYTDLLVSFSNTGTTIGYYPMIEVKLPAGLKCDATCQGKISITNLQGAPVSVTAFGPAGGSTSFTNPVTGNPVAVSAGESVLFLSLPVGSTAPNEPAITYFIPATVNSDAPLGVPLPVNATGVFALGAIPNGARGSCGAVGKDTLCSSATPVNVTPAVVTLEKSVENLVDGSTATGPSYPRRFKVELLVAENRTATNIAVSDVLPDTFVFLALPGADCKANPGSLTFTPDLDAGDSCSFTGDGNGGGTLTVTFASVTGGTAIDREVSYTGYVQKLAGGEWRGDRAPLNGSHYHHIKLSGSHLRVRPGIRLSAVHIPTCIGHSGAAVSLHHQVHHERHNGWYDG